MKWIYQGLLKRLLVRNEAQKQSELVQHACQALTKYRRVRYVTGKVATKDLVEIYERRSKYEWLHTKGFDVVLPALKMTKDAVVRIHGIEVTGFHCTIFTNVQTTRFFGVLETTNEK